MNDCIEIRTNFDIAPMAPAFWLASACSCKKRLFNLYHRKMRFGSIPIAAITSALRRLLVARLLEAIAAALASSSGFFETISLTIARISNTAVADLTDPSIVVYINDNGTVQQWAGNVADVPLMAHREITIQIGTALTALPTYDWSLVNP